MILRRLYLHLVSAASIGVLAIGLIGVGATLLTFLFNGASQLDRPQLAQYLAAVLVALPVWATHMWFARRHALRDPDERASAIRHLYAYAVCLGFSITFAVNLYGALESANRPDQMLPATQAAWAAFVALAIWQLHLRIAVRDRAAAGERPSSSTLRRWYMYSTLLIGVLMLTSGGSTALAVLWTRAMHSTLLDYVDFPNAVSLTIAGLVLWGFHAIVLGTRYAADDRKSTLRAVEGFIVVAYSIAAALVGGSEILYDSLDRLLGAPNPVPGTDLLVQFAQPASLLGVYALTWFLVRARLSRDASTGEAARQAAIRRLYVNLASLVSLVAIAAGAGALFWIVAELVEAPLIGVPASDWRSPVSLGITLLVVGGAVWLAHWRPAPPPPDRQSLSRRLYVWAALLASVLAMLGFAIALIYTVLQQLIQPNPRLSDVANLDFGHFLAGLVVAALVGVYHLGVLRADARARPAPAPIPPRTPPELPPTDAQPLIDLVVWRRHVGDLYRLSGPDAVSEFRSRRDELFKTHPQSPIEPDERKAFQSLTYFAYDPAYRVQARFENGPGDELVIDTGGADGAVRYRRAGRLVFDIEGASCTLTVLALQQYAGGLFVPFKDATSGHETYGGGRYLFDTAKNTDGLVLELTTGSREVTIDFNYAYNPSCVYSPRWACPLAPPENMLEVAIRAGEQMYRPA